MRRFNDASGRSWEVVAGRESWGAVFAIFIPGRTGPDATGDDDPVIRQTPLEGTVYGQAPAELDDMSDAELRALLERSNPKNSA